MDRRRKKLEVNDKLWSEGSWNTEETVVVSVTETEALCENGHRFRRDFEDGDTYLRTKDMVFFLDFYFWYLIP